MLASCAPCHAPDVLQANQHQTGLQQLSFDPCGEVSPNRFHLQDGLFSCSRGPHAKRCARYARYHAYEQWGWLGAAQALDSSVPSLRLVSHYMEAGALWVQEPLQRWVASCPALGHGEPLGRPTLSDLAKSQVCACVRCLSAHLLP